MRGLKEKRKRKEGRYDINTQWKEVITIAFAKEEAFGIVGKSSATVELVYTSGSAEVHTILTGRLPMGAVYIT